MGTPRLNTEAFWQSRADEARAIALHLQDANARQVMLAIADKYAVRAEMAKARLRVLERAYAPSEPVLTTF